VIFGGGKKSVVLCPGGKGILAYLNPLPNMKGEKRDTKILSYDKKKGGDGSHITSNKGGLLVYDNLLKRRGTQNLIFPPM